MKKLNLIALIALNLVIPVCVLHAGVSSEVQWEVRSTGNDNNGGGFIAGATGTDFSQQDAAQYTFSDLASTNGTTVPCSVTSVSHSFVAADVGNLIHISAGTSWTASWYQIVSVATGAATLDRACGAAATLSAGTYFVGGGLLTIAQAFTNMDNTSINAESGGSFAGSLNIKTGTYTITTGLNTGLNFGHFISGYQTTHGDLGTPPTITTATNSIVLITFSNNQYQFDNFNLSNTAVTPGIGISASTVKSLPIRNCTFTGFTRAVSIGGGAVYIISSEIKNSTSDAVVGGTSGEFSIIGSYIHNTTGGAGVNMTTNSALNIINSIISNSSTQGVISASASQLCVGSDIANNTGDGWQDTTIPNFTSIDCIYYGNGGFGVNGLGSGFQFTLSRNNAFGANTSGARNNFTSGPGVSTANAISLGDIALTASPFTSTTNFALNATVGGGAAINTKGYPGIFPGGLTTGTLAIGGVQASSGGSGGSGLQTIIYVK